VTVVWGEEYWDSVLALDGGTGLLHQALRGYREALTWFPELGDIVWGSEGK
jgi:hypothetical protein